jgi:hypothetical protein
MKTTTFLHLLLAGLLACAVHGGLLESDFARPPEATRPRCYWYWMDGQITKDGITRDLEAMKRVGIGEGYIGIISGQAGTPAGGAAKALTDEWWGFIEHAIREGTRLGVDVGLFNSPGWSQSGGPWVKPSEAMRYITMPELRIRGPQHFEGKLPVPAGEYQDVAVLAFPVPAGEGEVAKITSRTPTLVSFEMPSPFTARSITVLPVKPVNVTAELLASDDGRQYRTVRKFTIDRHNLAVGVGPVPLAPVVATLPATTARFFQLRFPAACELGDIQLSPAARLESYAEKSLLKVFQDPLPPFDFYTWPAQLEPDVAGLAVKPEAVRDLTRQMAADGTLRWDVPAGDWMVLRTALTPTGTRNSPAPPEATGFEVDKMNRTALKAHFDAYVGNLLKRMPAADRKSWKHVVADSYEQGPQNWTDGFAADFQKRYGYDPLSFLPVMTGRIVGSADQSDRFLWDVRRLVADRVAKDYVGALRDLCHENGLKVWLENYGHWGFPGEFLSYGGAADEIGGEYWVTGDLGSIECRDAASAAHIYGKPVVWAEAFTGGPAFINTPRDLKARGDWSFCEGINQFVLHVYIHQPADEKRPGVNAWFGTEFNRNNTWFEQSKSWIEYLRRCSVMLQAGNHVADVAYFITEDTPKMAGLRQPELPPGYDFDYINADVIENRLAVKDGRFVLPDGMSYRMLALPQSLTMRPGLLKKLRDLVAAGGVVLGMPPSHSPSLENFPKSDAEVQLLAREIWGAADLKKPGENPLGKGRVIWGRGLAEVLAALGSGPDFESSAGLRFKHRHSDDADIYFVANPKAESLTTIAAFRVGDKAPELWWPDSGRIERPAVYDVADGVVRLPLSFGPVGSVFVVFRGMAASKAERVVSVTRNDGEILGTTVNARLLTTMRQPADGIEELPLQLTRNPAGMITAQGGQAGDYQLKMADGRTRLLKVSSAPAPQQITGPWEVNFAPGRGAPEKITFDQLADWTKRPEDGIKHFSGKAVYRKTFVLDPSQVKHLNSQIPNVKYQTFLDLGKVNDIATVRINDRELATLWLPPYRVDITAAVKPGANTLEVEVVNTWNNRLAGDAALPLERRLTSVTAATVSKDTPLMPAGLLGPVNICYPPASP